jgi:23S rRNA pseudouridine2605 synthase
MEERLQKVLARSGVASRRAVEQLIVAGRVAINGKTVRELGTRADLERDVVTVDGERIRRIGQPRYLLLHKPPGYVTTRSDPEGRPTVYDLLPDIPGLFSVGRLDMETEGLLILTTDGDWADQIAHPRHAIEREYEVRVAGPVPPGGMERLREGIILDGRLARPVAARELRPEGNSAVLSVVMVEGRRREVRLLCAGAGIPIKRLIRRRFGNLLLGWLGQGHWRNLSQQEVNSLLARRARPGEAGTMPPPSRRQRDRQGLGTGER